MKSIEQLLQHPDVGFSALADGIEVTNPATGETVAYVKKTNVAALNALIARAATAQKDWAAKTALERADILWRWYQLLKDNKENLARLMTMEQGKSLAESRGEIDYAASFIRWFAEEARRIDGDILTSVKPNQKMMVIKQPIGVTAAITPWNFPAAMITRKAAPALAVGCAMLVKPATLTPLSAYAQAVLAYEAGIPENLFVIVNGSASEISGVFAENDTIRKISFTGSTEVGAKIFAASAGQIKKLSLELGGNAPFIVFDDADLEKAVQKVEEHIADALAKGAVCLAGGKRSSLGGTFFEPTVLRDVTAEMQVARDETFGPLCPVFKFDSEQEAVAAANNTEFGLASYFFTRDTARQWRIGEALEYGMVGINTGLISNEVAPFGGIKMSGLGREGSKYGADEYLELKYLCLDLS